MSRKLAAGSEFPRLSVKTLNDELITLGQARGNNDWQMLVVYRGKHCPLCTRYLKDLASYHARLQAIGIDLVAVSADSQAQLKAHLEQLGDISYTLAYGLTQTQMEQLGLYISVPASEQETDHNFAESGLFIINSTGKIQVLNLSNIPFARPELATLVSGLEWLRNPTTQYPIRGTLAY